MKYLIKNKETGHYQEISDILRFDKNTLKTCFLFFAQEINEEEFDNQIKNLQRMELMKEIEEKQRKLAELGGQSIPVPANLPVSSPQIPGGQSSVQPKTGPSVINPQTRKPYTKEEVGMMFNRLQEEVNRSEGDGIFESVMWVENEGNHFVACVNKMNPQFPRQMHGIPIIQKLDSLVDGFGQGR